MRYQAVPRALLATALLAAVASPTVEAQQPPQRPGQPQGQQPLTQQPAVPPRPWTFTPSLDVAERFDDNIFLTANDRTSDFITEVTPRLALQYQSNLLNIEGSYSIVAQYFAETTDLNNFGDNQQAILTLGYRPTSQLTLSLNGYYVKSSETTILLDRATVPVTVDILPTSESERTLTEQYTLNASGSYRFTPRTTGTATYSFAATDQEDTATSYSNSVGLGVSYQLTSRDVVLLNTTATFFTSSDDDTPDQESYSVTPGWTRTWTPSLTTTLNAGPQITDGDIRPTISAAASYQATRELSVNVSYSYGTGLVVGETGAQQTSSLAGSLVYQPLQDLRISVSGEWTNSAPLGGSFDEGDDWFFAADHSTVSSHQMAVDVPQLSVQPLGIDDGRLDPGQSSDDRSDLRLSLVLLIRSQASTSDGSDGSTRRWQPGLSFHIAGSGTSADRSATAQRVPQPRSGAETGLQLPRPL